jgi:hypothetical protein
MGSGSLAAMAIFEAEYKKDMEVCLFSIHLTKPSQVTNNSFNAIIIESRSNRSCSKSYRVWYL